MRMKEWVKENFSLYTVRKKVFFLSKISGTTIVLLYLITAELQIDSRKSLWVWVFLLVVVILGVDILLGKFITKPITTINQAAARMARLDFSKPCEIESNDEFGELSCNLNRMAENLQQTLAKLEIANLSLEKDVEQERLLLSQRKELVDTLSHEMKTPLGIIRAYTEGLREETNEDKKKQYMDIIIEETDRMNHMIVSLLNLSSLEAGATKLIPQRFDFIEFVETVAGRLLMDIPDEDFYLTYDLPEDKYFVYTDKSRMEQVLENLILNAKNHVVSGGNIKLSVTSKHSIITFSIYNQGLQIEEESLPKVWTKFYRSSQSQRSGGTGLGLAIVAQILTMQNLKYGLKNRADGVEFYFMLPTELEINHNQRESN